MSRIVGSTKHSGGFVLVIIASSVLALTSAIYASTKWHDTSFITEASGTKTAVKVKAESKPAAQLTEFAGAEDETQQTVQQVNTVAYPKLQNHTVAAWTGGTDTRRHKKPPADPVVPPNPVIPPITVIPKPAPIPLPPGCGICPGPLSVRANVVCPMQLDIGMPCISKL